MNIQSQLASISGTFIAALSRKKAPTDGFKKVSSGPSSAYPAQVCQTPISFTVEDVWKKRPEHIFDRHTDVPDKTRTYIVPMDVKAPCFLLYLSLHKLPNLYGSLFVMISPPGRVKYEKPCLVIIKGLVLLVTKWA